MRPAPRPQPNLPLTHWVKQFLVCNPFYLASAALLLFGLYRVSMDPNFMPEEVSQLAFNFTSLQCYELLLVGTAMLLARRMIWYDAKLLVVLENLLLLVPFLLIHQAALIDQQTVWLFSGIALLLVVARSALAQRGVPALRFPGRLTLMGACVLAVNAAWPAIYRHFQETKFGKNLDEGPAFAMHVFSWWVLLPALIALVNLLPHPREDGRSLVQSRRFPVGLLALWLAGTAVHLYALGYVYDFHLRREWLAPAVWVLAWTLHLRVPDYVESVAPVVRKLTLALPLPVTLIAANETGSNVFFALNALNLLAFARVVWRERGNRLAVQLTMLSFAALVAAMPESSFQHLTGWFNRSNLIGLAVLAYVIIASLMTRNPKVAVAGAIAAALAGGALRDRYDDAWHWAAQAGLVFFLLHSLRWRDYEHQSAAGVRLVLAAGWLVHAVAWVRDDAAVWHPLAMAGAVLVVCWFRGFVFQRWTPLIVPGTSLAVALCGPMNFLVTKLQSTPTGVTAIAASFLLFAIGTTLALTKNRWHKSSPSNAANDHGA